MLTQVPAKSASPVLYNLSITWTFDEEHCIAEQHITIAIPDILHQFGEVVCASDPVNDCPCILHSDTIERSRWSQIDKDGRVRRNEDLARIGTEPLNQVALCSKVQVEFWLLQKQRGTFFRRWKVVATISNCSTPPPISLSRTSYLSAVSKVISTN